MTCVGPTVGDMSRETSLGVAQSRLQDGADEGVDDDKAARERVGATLRAMFSQTNKSFVIQQMVPPLPLRTRCGDVAGMPRRACDARQQWHVRAAVLVVGNMEVFLQRRPKVYCNSVERDGSNGGAERPGAWEVVEMEELARQLEGVEGDEAVQGLVEEWLRSIRSAVSRWLSATVCVYLEHFLRREPSPPHITTSISYFLFSNLRRLGHEPALTALTLTHGCGFMRARCA